MSAQPIHGAHHVPIPRAQNAVAAALPAAPRMDFYREMGDASQDEIGQVLDRWWLLVHVSADPTTAATAAAVKAGTPPGRGATAVLRALQHAGA